jgi:hypothetical protein
MTSPSEPHDADAVLAGIKDIQQKLENSDLNMRLEALNQAWGYGDAGQILLQQALSDRTKAVRQRAHWLLF